MSSRSELLPIYIACYRLTQEIFSCTIKFPKEYKFLLGQSLNENALNLCCLISRINQMTQKGTYFEDFFATFERVRIELRLSADFNLLSLKKQAHLAVMLEDIHTQALAWRRSNLKKEEKTIT